MKELNSSEYKLMEHIFKLRQETLLKLLTSCLKKYYKNVVVTKDYLYAIGNIPIGLVAHTDTVFSSPPENIFYDREKGVLWSPEGLGADDRAGVYAILNFIKMGYRPTIFFLTEEEIGGEGAECLITDFPIAPTELKYLIELDRRGSNDCVFYNCNNQKFVDYVESFGFSEAYGTFTDISIICPAWEIAGVNLSIGYFNEHSYVEILNVSYLKSIIVKVVKMLKDFNNAEYYKYIPLINLTLGKEEYKCEVCGLKFSEYELIGIEDNNKTKYYCPDCCSTFISWCSNCGQPFKGEDEVLCPECERKLNKCLKK